MKKRVPSQVQISATEPSHIPEEEFSSSDRIAVRIFCRKHGRDVAQVREVRKRGAILLLRQPMDRVEGTFTAHGPAAVVHAVKEAVERYQRGEGPPPIVEVRDPVPWGNTLTGWCGGGRHQVKVDRAQAADALATYRQNGKMVKVIA